MAEDKQHIEFYDLVIDYLTGEANAEEVKHLEGLISQDPEKASLFQEIKRTWQLTLSKSVTFDENASWKNISGKIDNTENGEKAYPFAQHTTRRNFITRVAAVIIILIAAGYLMYLQLNKSSMTELVATTSVLEMDLTDGSLITLNNDSRLSYSKSFNEEERRVNLEGSAFFDVYRNELKPFIIETSGATISVLGTSFLVNARENKNTIEVVVSTGKVRLTASAEDFIDLEAGEKGIFNKTLSSLQKELNQDVNYLAWKTKKLVFENTPLSVVLATVEEAYQVEISMANPDLENCFLTATYIEYPVEDVLLLIAETLDLTLTGSGNQFELDGPGCE